MKGKRVLITGLHPSVVNYSKWPMLSVEKLTAAIEEEKTSLRELGYAPDICLYNFKTPPEAALKKKLSEAPFDCVMIGAGIRTDPDHFLMFEKLINVVHECAPAAKICFNTLPHDTADAVQRWV